jgi:hypothetical protein
MSWYQALFFCLVSIGQNGIYDRANRLCPYFDSGSYRTDSRIGYRIGYRKNGASRLKQQHWQYQISHKFTLSNDFWPRPERGQPAPLRGGTPIMPRAPELPLSVESGNSQLPGQDQAGCRM